MWTVQKIAEVLGAHHTRLSPETIIKNFKFDSRNVRPGDCFVALVGSAQDGHDFIQQARDRGVSCVIGQKDADFLVSDSYEALNQLALYARNKSPAKRIAITGSVGKTTTTGFISQLLQQNHKTIFPEGSFNNHVGVPLTMTKLSTDTEFGVFEIGTNHPGEIQPLAELVKPHISIITKIGTAHIENFNTKKNIALEKSQILAALSEDGIGIVPEDEFLDIYRSRSKNLIVLKDDGKEFLSTIPRRLQGNIGIALKVCETLGVSDFDIENIFVPEGRGKVESWNIDQRNFTIIDDSYNAAFDAFVSSLNDLSAINRRKILIVGDMAEVGELKESYHQEIAKTIESLTDVAKVVTVGPSISLALKQENFDQKNIGDILLDSIKDGDVLLFKGSNGSGIHKILKQFKESLIQLKNTRESLEQY